MKSAPLPWVHSALRRGGNKNGVLGRMAFDFWTRGRGLLERGVLHKRGSGYICWVLENAFVCCRPKVVSSCEEKRPNGDST